MNCLECPKAVTNSIVHASHPRGFHKPAQKCEENIIIFCLKVKFLSIVRNMPVLHCAGEFILQAIGSKLELLVMEDAECVCYSFNKPEFFCEERYNHIKTQVTPPLIFLH